MADDNDNIPSMADVASQMQASLDTGKPISQMQSEAPPKPAEKAAETPPPAPEVKPVEKAKEADLKPAEKKEETPVGKLLKKADAKPADEPKAPEEKLIDWKTAPKEFRERHEKLLADHKNVAQKATEYEKRVSEYEQKIKDIEAKSGDTSKADLKLVEEYTAKIAAAEAKIRALDYSQSDEYTKLRNDYQEKYSQRYIKAANELKDFQVTTGQDEAGNPVQRQATEADLKALLTKSVGEQRRLTRQMFGADADLVNRHLDNLRDLADDANFTLSKKLEEAKTNGEIRQKEQRLAEQKQAQEYQSYLEASQKEIETEFPDMFGAPKDDPEAEKAYQAGWEFVQAAITKVGSMTLQDRAAYNAVLQAKASAFDYQALKVSRLSSQVESLTKELEGLRGSDPGNGGARSKPSEKPADDIGGINEMAARILNPA
jgi:hypothetical protein